jgi:hypothetical protein
MAPYLNPGRIGAGYPVNEPDVPREAHHFPRMDEGILTDLMKEMDAYLETGTKTGVHAAF